MKLCPHCGHTDLTPSDSCKECGKKLDGPSLNAPMVGQLETGRDGSEGSLICFGYRVAPLKTYS